MKVSDHAIGRVVQSDEQLCLSIKESIVRAIQQAIKITHENQKYAVTKDGIFVLSMKDEVITYISNERITSKPLLLIRAAALQTEISAA